MRDAEEPESDEADGGCGIANDMMAEPNVTSLYVDRLTKDEGRRRSMRRLSDPLRLGCND